MDRIRHSTASVKVVLVPDGHVLTVAFAIGLSIWDLKCHLASEVRVPPEVLQFSLDGRVVDDLQTLMELGVQPHATTSMEMSSTKPTAHPLLPLQPIQHDSMPDVLTVQVQTDDGGAKEVTVEIERLLLEKEFLGGYRHRLTGAEYHHAAVQTPPKRRPDRGVAIFSRNTQTMEVKHQNQNCPVSISTQMTRVGCYVSCVTDKLVTPGNYVSAAEHQETRLRAVIRLQTAARRWLARQAVEQLRRDRDRRLAWMDVQERRRREEKEEQLRDRQQRWMKPQSRDDFNLLYHALEKWRCEEEWKINSSLRGADRKAALCLLLQQETQFITDIGRHRIAVHNSNYDTAVRAFLDKCAMPQQWRAADGRLIQMDNQDTIRARELRNLYDEVNLTTMSQDQRLQVLATLRHTVKEHHCPLTRDIVELIERETNLVSRGIQASKLEGLRKRISTLFLQYIKMPAFNPMVSKVLTVPQDPVQLKKDVHFCHSCHRYLSAASFSPSVSARQVGRCRYCSGLDNAARQRDDITYYVTMLTRLRHDEQQRNQDAKIPFLLQVEDLRYLVEVIWASRSAFSASSDLGDLLFVRWDCGKDWSPWNCILLTKEETSAHLQVEDVQKVYEEMFIHSIQYKHTLARQRFQQIQTMTEYLDLDLDSNPHH
ncbi:IQ and ubiquitin-like domain-containing protein [Thalassophryne amazonica]|uniref:IQ and ubiquitin-like domain-containing protein n=1 Tax=Thalassophryne amazonica TaxID=390379 RepID=UPI00147137C8|nr:IQ and ubiquitin-like domain-containing protein [Thalassophryne amazonica]